MPRGVTADELNLPTGTIVRVTKEGRKYKAVTIEGEDIADRIESFSLKNAFNANKALRLSESKSGTQWKQVPQVEYDKACRGEEVANVTEDDISIAGNSKYSFFDTHEELVSFIADSPKLKPAKIQIDDLTWKYTIASAICGENLLVLGPTGCGKTLLANCIKVALGRSDRFFFINAGATQDARSTLIGNTHFDKEKGTYVSLSYFAEAIQVPNAIILIDEISRINNDGMNILMPILDETQRYLRVDERADSATIKVAEGVTFILTANVGSEYSATRTLDRALKDRCTIIELKPIDKEAEIRNLRFVFPDLNPAVIDAIADVAAKTRANFAAGDTAKVNTIISTRMAEKWAKNVYNGLSFVDAAEVVVIPFFDEMGGAESARTYVKQMIQKHEGVEKNAVKKNVFAPPQGAASPPWAPPLTV